VKLLLALPIKDVYHGKIEGGEVDERAEKSFLDTFFSSLKKIAMEETI